MNPTATTSILNPVKTIENNALGNSEIATAELSDNVLSNDFTSAMKEAFTASGNTKPLEFADLKNLDVQQLADLAEQMGIHLPAEMLAESIDLKQTILNALAFELKPSSNRVNLVANPNADEILKSTIVNGDLFKNGITENSLSGNKTDLLNRVATDEVMVQAAIKKEPGLVNVLSTAGSESTNFLKELTIKDSDINRDLLMKPGQQDISTIKLSEQLASADRPINSLSSISNPTSLVQSLSNTTAPGTILNRVEVPVQQAGWGEAVGNRLMMMVSDKIQTASIRLNPAELGPIEVKVNVNQEQATVHFVSNNSVVRDAIEDAFPRLKEMFSQNGLSLADANVSQQSSQQSNSNSKNELQTDSDNVSLDSNETQAESKPIYIEDTGIVDHYV